MSDQRPSGGDQEAEGTGASSIGEDRLILTAHHRVAAGGDQGASPAFSDQQAAALRDLVRDVLRDELNGPFGERITRGVRKLVRAEIAAIMAARDRD